MSSDPEKLSPSLSNDSKDKEAIDEPQTPHIAFNAPSPSPGLGLPRTATLGLRRELTRDEKELAGAGYVEPQKEIEENKKHVDIVRVFLA